MQALHPVPAGQGMAEAALSAAQWALGKALGPIVDGVLGLWADATEFGPNVEELSKELLFVKATLEQAALKNLVGPATVELLHKLQDSAHNVEDLLDELDYFRIHDQLHNKHEAADEGGVTRDVRHTAKAVGKLVKCFPWQRPKHRQRSCGSSSLAPDTNQEFIGCMPKLSKLLPCSSSPHPRVLDQDHGNTQETPNLEFNTADISGRMKGTTQQLRLMRNEVHKILKHCGPRIVTDIAQSRPITKGRIDEHKLYGRDNVMDGIIHDITKGQYCEKGLSVLPIIGPGGIGKTTLIQHIYRDERVKNHFPIRIWICVSLNFNLEKVLEQIKKEIPAIQSEEVGSTTEELFEQRLKSSKRFLLVLDDIWQISNGDDWGELLSTLGKSQEKGCMILVTTRFQAIAQKVKTTDHPKELNGLEPEEFKKLFIAFIFDDGQYPVDKPFLLEHGAKIMEKLKGSPLAAKTVGRLLKTDLSSSHWKRVLKSKQWAEETDGIMPALKLSYEFLPFHLQRCFSYSALFPEDYRFRSHELTSLWIGLDILIPGGQNQTLEKIGLSNLEDLVIHGFFREEDDGDEDMLYVMHDLLHDLALKVASHDCLSLRLSDVGPMEIQPSIRHLTISIDDLGEYDAVSGENLKSKLEELKTRYKVKHLQTLMLFGEIDENLAKIFGDFFEEANALRVLYLPNLMYPVESMLHNFSRLVHLRYLCIGTNEEEMNLPLSLSKIYHLRILSLELWAGSLDLPEDMSNLAKLCHFYTPYGDELHPDIYNVGKLKLLEELKVFRVKKESKGFEPKQLEHLTKVSELGIYNLEKIHTEEEAKEAKLIERSHLRRLTLDWDSERSTVEPRVEAVVLEGLQPHGDLQVLCIRGHGGPSCPTWLGDEFAVEDLKYLCLDGVSWEVFPSLGKTWDLLELRLVHIARPKEFTIEKSFCMLRKLELLGLESFERWVYLPEQESSSGGDLVPPDAPLFPHLQELNIRGCPKLN